MNRKDLCPMTSLVPARRLTVAALVFVLGCYPKVSAAPPVLSAADADRAAARWPGVSASSLLAGRDHFLAKCNGCHGYPDLSAISDERWPAIVTRMAGKAHLTPEEGDGVLHFILASRAAGTKS
jgi:hypothetical protein